MDQEFEELAKFVGQALADRWLREREPPWAGGDADGRNAIPMQALVPDSRADRPTPPPRKDRYS
jgi:hypothetical protein